MVKLIIIIINLILTFIGYCLVNPNEILGIIVTIIISFIASLIIQAIVFFLIAFLITLPVSKKKEYKEYNKTYRHIFRNYTRFVLSLFGVKIKCEGLEKLPQNETFALYFNHRSNVDSLIIDVTLSKYPLVFVGKESLFHIPFFGKMIRKVGYINLERGHLRSEFESIKRGINYLENNECSVGIAPEGKRNFTEETLLEFKPGAFNLVTKTHKDLVIITLKNTEKVKKNLLLKRHPVEMKVLDVIKYEDIKEMKTSEIANLVREKMLEELE